jgi:hypothetical protein
VLGRPSLVPNTIPFQQLVAVGLPAWLPGGAQTPAWRDLVGFSQAPKQEGVACFNRPKSGHDLDAGPGWPQPCFQTCPKNRVGSSTL